MSKHLLLAACLVITPPLALNASIAAAQAPAPPPPAAQSDAPPPPGPGAPPPPPRHEHADHDWGSRRDWDRDDARHRGMDHDRGWGRGDRGSDRMPFGMWWKNPAIVESIGLTTEQQKQITDLFIRSRVKLITLHATLQQDQLLLEPLLDATPFDEAKAMEQIDKIADTRADLEKTNAKMLLDIRGVLSADQWTKLRDHRHRMHPHGDWGGQMPPQQN